MNRYAQYRVNRRTAICTCCLLLSSLACVGGSCQRGFVQGTWTLIEVTDSRSGNPVTEVTVTADGSDFESGLDGVTVRDPGPVPLAPTDASGHTYVPVHRVGDRPFLVDLALRLEHGLTVEDITIPNRIGALAETNDLRVRIVDIGADGPPPPLLAAVIGSQPAQISVNGYVADLALCSNADDGSAFRIQSPHVGAYVGTLSVGSIPLGFESIQCSDPNDPASVPSTCRFCPSSVLARIPPNGFTLIAYEAFDYSGGFFEGESFCLDAEGAVIACP